MKYIRLKAYGKINLGLDVIRRREDGYHEVRMIMQTVKIFDKIYMEKTREGQVTLETNLPYLPVNENNLMIKAAKLLMDEFGIKEGLHMKLNKFIPVSAGMAGGSTDAASVLYGVNRLFELGLSVEQLMERGVKIGADVPYCLMRGTALSEGIGEKLTRLKPVPECFVLLAKPPVSVSTQKVYQSLKLDEMESHPDIDGIIRGIEQDDIRMVADCLGNALETVTIPMHPVIEQIKSKMIELGAMNALMSGSGPTVFGLFEKEEQAYAARDVIREMNVARQVYVTEFYNNDWKERRVTN